MSLIKIIACTILVTGIQIMSFAQDLDKICPVLLQQSTFESDFSFVLTATDYDFFLNKPDRFYDNIQIVDADQPWPPRWFCAMPKDTSLGLPYSALIPLNASYQDNKFSFFTIIKTKGAGNTEVDNHGYLILDSTLAITDTFIQRHDLDHHDFRLQANGEKLFFVLHDTIVDMSAIHHKAQDSALNLFYENIEIQDSAGRICFSWDPVKNLGIDAPFNRYWNVKGFWNKPGVFDWSHGNALSFDYDGDILYSYKFIGIGKISRKDGHIIWKVDRKQIQPNSFSDSIPLFLQHDFKGATDAKGNHFYTFVSNGDNMNKRCSMCQFTVTDTLSGQKVFRIKKRYYPLEHLANTAGGGNYDVEQNGSSLINYGHFKSDTTQPRALFEYRNARDQLMARYQIDPFILAYRIHKLSGWRPPRPLVNVNNGTLSVNNSADATWYELEGQKHTATFAGIGKSFKPKKYGVYCAVVKYGIGYAVSTPVNVSK